MLSHDDFEKALGSMLAAGELEEAHHAELHDERSSGDDFSDDDSGSEGGGRLVTSRARVWCSGVLHVTSLLYSYAPTHKPRDKLGDHRAVP